jgi:hypothetical protein
LKVESEEIGVSGLPSAFNFAPACWDGHVSEEWQKHEHPLEKISTTNKHGSRDARRIIHSTLN